MTASSKYFAQLKMETKSVASGNFVTICGRWSPNQTIFSYRNRCAAKMADENGHILKRLHGYNVLRKKKHENKQAQYSHDNPIKTLASLKRKTTIGQNVIHKIDFDPFSVQFWSSHQLRTYNSLRQRSQIESTTSVKLKKYCA